LIKVRSNLNTAAMAICNTLLGVRCLAAILLFLHPVLSIEFSRRQFLTDGLSSGAKSPELCWGYNDTHIEVQLSYPTLGWIAMGLSPNGGMDQSDILFGYVNDTSNEVVVQVSHNSIRATHTVQVELIRNHRTDS
jgi:hypothetical protein